MSIYEQVKALAQERGLSLQTLAIKAGMGINSIYSWQKKDPSISRLTKVAEILNVSVDSLIGADTAAATKKSQQVDLNDDDVIMTFEGRPIPPEDLAYIKRILGSSDDNAKSN
ncbi:MAG: helix-turn-helix domain-containing protein [Furfurilactobacillus sp.]|jgi:transcriptional regulator with XRE-family HTH domain|uniref:helix-turn-helix domain-containing protein n=1 Tax=Furfurilactobacillus TaxID=2767882 RepID=UPI001F44165E|nr:MULTISPECIES: helix-turn-helix transcriptional regulator [Furfurilactobacillus]MCF6419743.1 helix-turn-helix domain-containing protein [Furfurilactobacillus milii]MCH4012647.1 helix-turn-helix domain-containing protein [Furfurilactobacillus sp.]MCH4036230.1 helix-turn-helix domain-containing protein [Furfurilactobacillus sp.]MCH4114824.1 helix-turn-helix domain-containing protein [Furfurilactobacillus sp.]MCH4133599.1 helix-turn-helix domain-containing protein [Furfurilactobacillus sp.]